jgi:hypothetical protein
MASMTEQQKYEAEALIRKIDHLHHLEGLDYKEIDRILEADLRKVIDSMDENERPCLSYHIMHCTFGRRVRSEWAMYVTAMLGRTLQV